MTRRSAALAVAMIALATDMVVYGIAVPVLPTIAADAGASEGAIGLLFASYAAALIVATPLVGRWVDRAGLRTPMMIGLGGLAAATLLFAFAGGLPLLIGARVLQGVAASVTWTASFALLAASYPPDARGRAMGTALSAVGIGTLAGPPLGGLLYEQFGQEGPFLFAAALAAGDGLARWAIVRDPPRGAPAEGYRAILGDRRVPLLFLLTALGAGLLAFMEPILPLHLAAELGADAGTVGFVFGLAVLASSLVAPAFGAAADRLPKDAMIATGAGVGAAGFAALAAAENVWLVGVGLAVVAIGGALVLVPTLPLIGAMAEARTPPSYGAAYALYSLAYAAGLTAAPLLAGGAADVVDFEGAALMAAAATVAAGAAGLAVIRRRPVAQTTGVDPREPADLSARSEASDPARGGEHRGHTRPGLPYARGDSRRIDGTR